MPKAKTEQPAQGNSGAPAPETYEARIARLAATVRLVESTPEEVKERVAKLDANADAGRSRKRLYAIAEALGVSLLSSEARENRLRRLAAEQDLYVVRRPSHTSDPDYYMITEAVSPYGCSLAEAEAWLSENACKIRSQFYRIDDHDWGPPWQETRTLNEVEALLSEWASEEGLCLRASDGAYDLLLDPEVCVDPDGRQWMLRSATLDEVHDWFAMWDQIRRGSAATEATLARLIPENIRNSAEGINADGEDDGRGASSAPWETGEGVLEKVPSGGEEMP